MIGSLSVFSATAISQDLPDPRKAMLKSMVMPGWGHYYVDKNDWTRGKLHLSADLIIIGAYFGFDARSRNIETQFTTFAQSRAGVSIEGRDRSFVLSIGQFNTLQEYNDFQLRSRNWNRIIPDTPENRWNWSSSDDRQAFRDLRQDADRARNQLPGLVGLLVLNRVFSGISAFTRARNMSQDVPELSLLPVRVQNSTVGVVANLSLRF